jgi:hypothetical protein
MGKAKARLLEDQRDIEQHARSGFLKELAHVKARLLEDQRDIEQHARSGFLKELAHVVKWVTTFVGQMPDERLAQYAKLVPGADESFVFHHNMNADSIAATIAQLERVRVLTFGGKPGARAPTDSAAVLKTQAALDEVRKGLTRVLFHARPRNHDAAGAGPARVQGAWHTRPAEIPGID